MNQPLLTVAKEAYDMFRRFNALAAEHPEVAAVLREHAREAEQIGVRAWHAAVKLP